MKAGNPEISPQRTILVCGLNWNRKVIDWEECPAITGSALGGSIQVNLAAQKAVYDLLDGKKVIYSGSTRQRELGTCLYEHTRTG